MPKCDHQSPGGFQSKCVEARAQQGMDKDTLQQLSFCHIPLLPATFSFFTSHLSCFHYPKLAPQLFSSLTRMHCSSRYMWSCKADMFDFYSGQLQLKSIFVLDFKPWSSHWLHAPLFFIWIKKPNVTLFLNPPLSLICQHPSCSFTPLAHCYRKCLFSALHTALIFPAQVQLNWTLNSNLLTFEAPH